MAIKSQMQFVGHDDISDFIWDTIPPGDESDYNIYDATLEVIETWPSLIGWHPEVAVAPAIESIIDEAKLADIVARHKVGE